MKTRPHKWRLLTKVFSHFSQGRVTSLFCETTGNQALEKLELDITEVKKTMETEDVRKSPGPDGISNWILREDWNNDER